MTSNGNISNNLMLNKKLILEVLETLTNNELTSIYGVKNMKEIPSYSNSKVEIKSLKGLMVNATVTVDGEKFDVFLDFSNKITRCKCSCRNYLQTKNKKHCIHLAIAAVRMKDHPKKYILDFAVKPTKELKHSKEELEKIKQDHKEYKKNIEALKLDPELIKPALNDVKI